MAYELPETTASDLGYRMPAEWSDHRATWISWPHNQETWPGKFDTVEPVMVEAVRALATSEPVHVNVLNADHERHVRGLFGRVPDDVRFFHIPTNDAWCRDHGATFLTRSGDDAPLAAVDWDYNAWGGKYPPFDLDRQVAGRMAAALGVPVFRPGIIFEGGAIDSDGHGRLLTTPSCILNANRNPGLTRTAAEGLLKAWLGAQHVIWVGGDLLGDDTDGHVDNIARFVSVDDAVMVRCEDPDDPHHALLESAFLEFSRDAWAHGIRIHALPLPPAVHHDGHRLPASYANFYVANRLVLMPTYNGPQDDEAAAILAPFFPGRRIVGVDCTDLVWGLGAFHCLTQQVPA